MYFLEDLFDYAQVVDHKQSDVPAKLFAVKPNHALSEAPIPKSIYVNKQIDTKEKKIKFILVRYIIKVMSDKCDRKR